MFVFDKVVKKFSDIGQKSERHGLIDRSLMFDKHKKIVLQER